MKSSVKSKSQKINIKAGQLIQIETNCRVFKEVFDGVELIVEQYTGLKLGAHYIDSTHTITELTSGMMIFKCNQSEDYMQLIIDKLDLILEVIGTERYRKQVERLKILPSEYEWLKMWGELESILQLKDLRKYCTGRLSQNVLELGLLEHEIYVKNRIGQQSSNDFYGGKSCKTYILNNYGVRVIELIEKLSSY